MKGVEQRTCHQRGRPYHAWRGDEKPTCDPTSGEANQLRGNDEEPLIYVRIENGREQKRQVISRETVAESGTTNRKTHSVGCNTRAERR